MNYFASHGAGHGAHNQPCEAPPLRRQSRRQLCRNALLLALSQLLFFALPSFAASPNILLVYVDDLGYGDTAVYGHTVVKTPHIDRLAAEGLRFTQFYAPSALCSPSRAGLLTGRTPYRTGVRDWIPPDSDVSLGRNETTLADLAKQAGYRTAVIGKWHLNGGLGMADAPQPRDFGFDYQYGLDAWVKNAAVATSDKPRRGPLYPDNMYRNNQPVGATDRYSAELVSDEAIGWLTRDDTPFFLLLTYSEVHTPIASPPQYLQMYQQFLTPEARANPLLFYREFVYRPWRGRGEYYANISYLDAQLGRVLEHLRKQGVLDNTLVIFSSDNGPVTDAAITPWELGMAGETGGLRGKKRFLFEGGLRVPGIIRYPALVGAGTTVDEPVTALDLFPTLAELFAQELPDRTPIDGQSLLPLLRGDAWQRQQPLYWAIETPDGMEYALRDGDWKLILDGKAQPRYLFDLSRDLYEVNNLLGNEPQRVAAMIAAFTAYQNSVDKDPLKQQREHDGTPDTGSSGD